MRSRIDVSDELMRRARQRAADENTSVREIIDRALRQYLAVTTSPNTFKLHWKPHSPGSIQARVVLEDRDSLFDLMEGRG